MGGEVMTVVIRYAIYAIVVGLFAVVMAIWRGRVSPRNIAFKVAAPFIGAAGVVIVATGVVVAFLRAGPATVAYAVGVGIALVLMFIGASRGSRAARAAR